MYLSYQVTNRCVIPGNLSVCGNGAPILALLPSNSLLLSACIYPDELILHHRESPGCIVTLGGILFKFAPVLLANIPFQICQAWAPHGMLTWSSVAVLGYGELMLVAYMFISSGDRRSRVRVPVDPPMSVGRMCYVCDSQILQTLGDSRCWRAIAGVNRLRG